MERLLEGCSVQGSWYRAGRAHTLTGSVLTGHGPAPVTLPSPISPSVA